MDSGRPSVSRAGSRIPGLAWGTGALLGGGEPLGRYSRDRGEHACVRVFQARPRGCPLVCPPQLGNPSPDPGGEATSPRRPGVPREQPGGSAAPGVTVGSWWDLLRLEPQDFKGPVSVVFTFRILAKLGEGTILPLTPSRRGRAGERVSKYRSGAEEAKTQFFER